ncbi:MAG: histidine kinase dimerization/phospho-acceptor domain-containing protein [Candidatus Omnitrophica bacterium]|nr:histidine kinase dimerization/phospho-acceptor domain-containing protein [Candidatus Omnitrophota bacterium]
MKELFEGQFDYIYFFYGLSFFLLGVICFSIDKPRLHKIPWKLLGLFGITHGLSEWLEMLQIVYGKVKLFSVLNLFVLAASFIFLLEFARVGFYRIKGKIIGIWVYVPILLLLPLAYKFGIDGWSITIRYFLGFSGVYFASQIIYEFYRTDLKGSRSLVFLSATMVLYAALTALVVPKAPFFPANIINTESFYRLSGMPVQLVRGIIALCMAIIVWYYSATPSGIKYSPPAHFIRFLPTKWLIALTVIILITGGWMFTNYLDYYAGIRIIKNTKARADSPLNRLIKELTLLSKVTVSMSKISVIREAVSDKQQQNIEKVKEVLNQHKDKYHALSSMLLDKKGMVIASVTSEGMPTEDNRLYSGKPYFKDALGGDNGYYFDLGTKYNERKYYVSYPVKNKYGDIAGVITLTKNIQAEPILHYRLLSIVVTFFVCCLAIIFFITLRHREDFLDLVERAHTELLTVDKMKSDFISIVSHELRTPLTSIRNAASILLKGGIAKRPVNSNEKELLNIIMSNVDRQAKMVSDLLDISKIEENLISLDFKLTDMCALAQKSIKSLQPQAEAKKINMLFVPDIKEAFASIDPDHTLRIIDNLIVNAIKFTPEG